MVYHFREIPPFPLFLLLSCKHLAANLIVAVLEYRSIFQPSLWRIGSLYTTISHPPNCWFVLYNFLIDKGKVSLLCGRGEGRGTRPSPSQLACLKKENPGQRGGNGKAFSSFPLPWAKRGNEGGGTALSNNQIDDTVSPFFPPLFPPIRTELVFAMALLIQ